MNINTLIPAVIALGFIAWVIVQQVTTQRYTLRRIWTIPAILAVVIFMNFKPEIFNNQDEMLALGVAAVLGGSLGLIRGSINKVSVDYSTGELIVRGSVLGLLMWIGCVAVDICLRLVINGGSFTNGTAFNTVLPLTFITAMFVGWRLVWYLKYSQQLSLQR